MKASKLWPILKNLHISNNTYFQFGVIGSLTSIYLDLNCDSSTEHVLEVSKIIS